MYSANLRLIRKSILMHVTSVMLIFWVMMVKRRSSDDREPSGTAGRPILGQLRSQNLTNILLIVVRYFGGTELGAANLGRAYKTAAADALTKAQIKEIVIMDSLVFESPYPEIDRAMRIARDLGGKIVSQTYADQSVKLKVNIRSGKIAELRKKLSAIYTIKFLK